MTGIQVVKAWTDFQTQSALKRPTSEAEYLELMAVMHYLLDHHNCDEEPYASLLGLVGTYMHEWELENEPELKNPEVAPHEMLAFYMDQHGLNQSDLEREGVANRTLLSKVLSGKRAISKELAKKLARRFNTEPGMFL